MIPYRGAWLEYETDLSDMFYVRIDKNRKLPITCLIRAVGPKTDTEILELFGEDAPHRCHPGEGHLQDHEDALLEIYRKLRPGEPPTVESAEQPAQRLFFDPRRYDLSAVGRYKFNKKLSIWHPPGEPDRWPSPWSDSPDRRDCSSRRMPRSPVQLAEAADNAGVNVVVLNVEGKKVKVITNGCVDAQGFVSFDVKECGINERCSFEELKKILDTTSDVEEQKELLRRNHDQLIGQAPSP